MEASPEHLDLDAALQPYADYLAAGTWEGQDWSVFGGVKPASRYKSFRRAFELFATIEGKTIVEIGTIRSYVHGGLPGCNEGDDSLWEPHNPKNWDWGAGCFSLMAAECLKPLAPKIHTVDLIPEHIRRCRLMTQFNSRFFEYHVQDSLQFLTAFKGQIDLLYLDSGDIWPIEPSAQHQRREVEIVVKRNLLSPNGILLIDDVRTTTPIKFGEKSRLGKAKYSLPFLLNQGFRVDLHEYQVILRPA